MNYYTSVLKNYAVFSGRTARKGYWMFILVNFVVSLIISFVAPLLGDKSGIIGIIYMLAVLIPTWAVGARRLHDINKSGWWQLIALIPIIGGIWLIVLFATDSNLGDNRFGANPKGPVATVVPPTTPAQN
jgi:uncharacterized membrane protein YhaH (DUF805 family)